MVHVFKKIAETIKNKESLRNCHGQEEPEETRQLNITWCPGRTSGTEKNDIGGLPWWSSG